MLDKKEIGIISGISVFLGIIISINFHGTILSFEYLDILKNILVLAIIFFVFVFAEKIAADLLECKIKIKLLQSQRLGFRPIEKLKKGNFPWWFILPVLTYLLALGLQTKFIWLSVLNFDTESKPARIKKRFFEPTEWDMARIALAGTFSMIILGAITNALGYTNYSLLCNLLALSSVIPIGQGLKVFFSSKWLWIFSIALTITIFLLSFILNPITTIIISIIFAILAVFLLYGKQAEWGNR